MILYLHLFVPKCWQDMFGILCGIIKFISILRRGNYCMVAISWWQVHLLIVQLLLFHFAVGLCDFPVRYLLKTYYQYGTNNGGVESLDDSMIYHCFCGTIGVCQLSRPIKIVSRYSTFVPAWFHKQLCVILVSVWELIPNALCTSSRINEVTLRVKNHSDFLYHHKLHQQ